MSLKAVLALAPAVLLSPLMTAQSADWRFADPGAQLIGGVDVHAVLDSPLVKGALDQVAAKLGDAAPMMQMRLSTVRGISQVYFSVTSRKDDADGLIMIKGTVDDAMLRGFLQGQAARKASSTQTIMDVARIDANTVLLGSQPLLLPAVERMGRPAATTANPLLARAKTLSAGNDFWIGGALPEVPGLAVIAGGIKGISLGVSLQQQIRFQLSLSMATAEMAKQMAAQMEKSANETLRSQAGLDTKVETKVVGSTINIGSSVDTDQLLKALAEKLKDGIPTPAGVLAANGPQTAARSNAPAQPAAPQPPKTIKILGLDEGPREVPFPANH